MEAHYKDAIALHDADPQEPLFVQERGREGPDLFPRPVVAGLAPVEVILSQLAELLLDVEDVPAELLTSTLARVVRCADALRSDGLTHSTKEGGDIGFARHGHQDTHPLTLRLCAS